MHDAVREALGVLWPRACAGCGAPDRGVCAACAAAFARVHVEQRDGVAVRWAATYDGAARAVVLAAKEEGRAPALRVLAAALARLVAATVETADQAAEGTAREGAAVLAVLVPASRQGTRRRGFVPVRMLARRARLAAIELVPVEERQQKRRARADRLRHAGLRVRPRDVARLRGARVVVVDDVVTTGATLREAVHAARLAGAEVLGAVVVARVPRHG